MTFLNLLLRLFGLISLGVLTLAVYLIWTGYQRADVGDPGLDPTLAGEGDETRLWIGWGLLALSFLGRFVWPLLLAKGGDKAPPIERGEARDLTGADGSKLRVETFGSKESPVLVLTHGWGLDSTVWRYARAHLAGSFRLIVWDLPGLGKSRLPEDRRIQLERFAEDLRTVIGVAEGKPVVLVGHSIGGMTLQTLAGIRPELMGDQVKGLVLLNTTHLRPIRTTALSGLVQALWPVLLAPLLKLQIWLSPLFHLMAWQSYLSGQAHIAVRIGGFGRHVTRQQLEHVTLLSTKNSQSVQAKGDFAMMDWDVTRKLPEIRVPTLVVVGDRDLVTRPDAGETIAKAIPGARLQRMEGCGHMGFYEYSQVYDAAIANFASEVLAAQPAVATPSLAQGR